MALTQSPTYPVAGEAVTVTSDASAVMVADYAVELTSVPSASALSTGLQLLDSTSTASDPIAAAEALILADGFTPDVAGEYGVVVYVIQQRPPSAPGDTTMRYAIAATESGTVEVAQLVELPISTVAYGTARLRLTVAGTTIRAATLREFSSEHARIAALNSTVVTNLAALVGVTVATAVGDFTTRVNDLRTQFAAHAADATEHNAADTTYTPVLGLAYSTQGGIELLNDLRVKLLGHMLDSDETTPWHNVDDTDNQPVVGTAQDLGGATVLLSDLRERLYERHRVLGDTDTPDVHLTTGGDTTNALSAPTALDDVIVAYLDALVADSPTPPTGEVDGAVLAATDAGFTLVA